MSISVLVADSTSTSRQELITQLQRERSLDVVGDASDGRETIEMARSLRPGILVLDAAVQGLDATSVVEQVQGASPDTGVIVLVDGADLELVRRLMRAGARDCLPKPVSPEELVSTVNTVHSTLAKQREAAGLTGLGGAHLGTIICVYSPQGGAGKSMLATNLAVAMAQATGSDVQRGRVALLDLNLQFGDLDLMLNLSPENTIAGLAQKGSFGVDQDLVEQFLTIHEASGLRIMVAPSTPQYAEAITVYTIEQVLESLRENYQFVIMDAPSVLQDTTIAAMDAASVILLVTTLDLLALHKTRTALEMLQQLYLPEKIQVVLNRSEDNASIKIKDVEATLGVTLSAQIPSDARVVAPSVNEGNPLVLRDSETLIARRITNLALKLMGREPLAEESEEKRGGLLGRFFS